jgi:hypothetical protein
MSLRQDANDSVQAFFAIGPLCLRQPYTYTITETRRHKKLQMPRMHDQYVHGGTTRHLKDSQLRIWPKLGHGE